MTIPPPPPLVRGDAQPPVPHLRVGGEPVHPGKGLDQDKARLNKVRTKN